MIKLVMAGLGTVAALGGHGAETTCNSASSSSSSSGTRRRSSGLYGMSEHISGLSDHLACGLSVHDSSDENDDDEDEEAEMTTKLIPRMASMETLEEVDEEDEQDSNAQHVQLHHNDKVKKEVVRLIEEMMECNEKKAERAIEKKSNWKFRRVRMRLLKKVRYCY